MTSPSKRVSASRVELNQFMMAEHANMQGTVHGGVIMKLADEAGGLCAIRHAQRPVVTVTIDSMTFHSPVHVGDVLNLQAHMHFVGRTSMEVGIKVIAEDPISGQQVHTNSAYAVYVALDDDGKPTRVPGLILESDEERQRWAAGERRQARRLQEDHDQ